MLRILIILLLSSLLASGQNNPDAKRDNTWVFGNNYLDCNTEYTIDFDSGYFQTHLFNHNIHLWANNSSISDTSGHLLFFSNGQQIVDKNGNIMENGDSLVTSSFYDYYNQFNSESSYPQSICILPQPNQPGLYKVFHMKYDWAGGVIGVGPVCIGLYITTVDMNENNGLGKVISKGQPVINDTLPGGGITAVRHGNGRDWWVLICGNNTHRFYAILLDPEGIHVNNILLSEIYSPIINPVTSCFSPDGSKFVRFYRYHFTLGFYDSIVNIDTYAFNRCAGFLTPLFFFQQTSISYFFGLSISANSKFVYMNSEQSCYQFNLQSSNILSSKITVAEYDGFDPNGHPTVFGFHALASDNKIYIGAGNSKYLHVIENPDLTGDSCNFIQRAIELPARNMYGTLPNLPNFRLGRLIGSECDTLLNGISESVINKNITIMVFPNPVINDVSFELNLMNQHFFMRLEIYDLLSTKLGAVNNSPFQSIVHYNTSILSNGIYFAVLKKDGKVLAKCKFIKDQ
jgi:hypothetical protein